MTKDILACVDCKYYYRTWGMKVTSHLARCKHNHDQKIDLVTGKVAKIHPIQLPTCRDERDDFFGQGVRCGVKGQHWSPRKSSPKTTMLLLKKTNSDASQN